MRKLLLLASLLLLSAVAEAKFIPDAVKNHHPAWVDEATPQRDVPPLRDFLPLGVYGGSYGEGTWNFVLDDLRKHHMNCWWMNGMGGDEEALDRLLTLGEKAGVRLYWADGGHGLFFPAWSGTPESRKQRHETEIVPMFKRYAERFRDRWGLLCWGLCEEMPPSAVEELQDYIKLVQREDPKHPPLLLYNNVAAAKRDCELRKPAVISSDIYPFGRDPRCAPDTVATAQTLYRRYCRTYYEIAHSAGAAFWVIAQGMGSNQAFLESAPWFGWMGAYYFPNPAFCSWEAWSALQEGATGVFYYHYYGYYGEPELDWKNSAWEYTLRSETWRETAQLWEIGRCFGEVEKVAPYLLRAGRDESAVAIASSETRVSLQPFRPTVKPQGLLLVLAVNDDTIQQRSFQLMHNLGAKALVWDLGADREVTEPNSQGKLLLPAGWGKLLAVGSFEEINAYKAACGQPVG